MSENPYAEFQDSETWKIIEMAIKDLVDNQDIEETTSRNYIVGYLVKRILESKLLNG